jgi:hypothetical protein
MNSFWITVLVLSPAILYSLALVVIPAYRGRCRQCRKRGLRNVGSYKWDGAADDGGACGGIVIFYSCQYCGARLKKSGADWSTPTNDEWTRHTPRAA